MKTRINMKRANSMLPLSILTTLFILLSVGFTVPFVPQTSSSPNISASGDGIIKGVVLEKGSSNPVPSASILLYKSTCLSAEVHSASNGRYLIARIPEGTYILEVFRKGYKPVKEKVVVLAGQTTVKDIALELLSHRDDQHPPESEQLMFQMQMESSVSKIGKKDGAGIPMMGGSIGIGVRQDQRPDPGFNTESYDRIRENGFREVIHDPLSTFSVDVDRASYSNVRRFLSHNTMPYKDAVRIEEMINYFEYDYPQPANGDPFSVTLETSECFWNSDHQLVLIGLQGKTMATEKIPPANLVFLIDVSGSMESPNKLPLLRQAFKILVNNLRPIDKVAMVVYAGAAGCVLEATPGSHKEKITQALDNLHAGGSTAGGDGIRLAYQIAKQNFIPGGNNRVILATDGDFNIGASSDGEMTRLIEDKRKEGVFLSVLGFGMGNYKDSKMEQISNAGNGNYAYIDNIMEAKKVFGEELWGTLFTIARDVKIQVEFNPEKIKAYRLIGYENRILNKEDFNDDKKDAGDIGSGHTVTALYEIIPVGSGDDVSRVDPLEYQQVRTKGGTDMMTLKLRYKHPEDSTSQLMLCRMSEKNSERNQVSENLKFAASVASFGMLLRESEYRGNTSYEQVIDLANASIGTDRFGYRHDFIRMVETAKLLDR